MDDYIYIYIMIKFLLLFFTIVDASLCIKDCLLIFISFICVVNICDFAKESMGDISGENMFEVNILAGKHLDIPMNVDDLTLMVGTAAGWGKILCGSGIVLYSRRLEIYKFRKQKST